MYIYFGTANGKKDFFGNEAKVVGTQHKLIKIWPIKIWIGYEHYIVIPAPNCSCTKRFELEKYHGKTKSYIEIKFC